MYEPSGRRTSLAVRTTTAFTTWCIFTVPPGCAALGEGIAYHRAAVDRAGLSVGPEKFNQPRAEVVHRIGYTRAGTGASEDLTALVPIYVRRPEAEEVWERRHGTEG